MKLSPGKATVAAWLKDAPHGCVALCGETDAFRAIARHAVLHFATVPQDLGTASSSSSCTKTSTTAGQEDAAAASSASPTNNPDAGAPIVDNNNNNKTAAAAAAAAAVELGASYGCCTKILANRGFETIGVDVSEEALAEAQKIAPTAKLVKADILQNREELLPALQDLLPEVRRATGRPLMLLVDLGGNRPGTLRPVLEAILWFADYLGPDLTVVKSRDLWQDATKYLLKHDKSSLEAWPAAYLAATANDEVRSDKKKKWTGRERPLNGDGLASLFWRTALLVHVCGVRPLAMLCEGLEGIERRAHHVTFLRRCLVARTRCAGSSTTLGKPVPRLVASVGTTSASAAGPPGSATRA